MLNEEVECRRMALRLLRRHSGTPLVDLVRDLVSSDVFDLKLPADIKCMDGGSSRFLFAFDGLFAKRSDPLIAISLPLLLLFLVLAVRVAQKI